MTDYASPEDRIRLAEFMGWRVNERLTTDEARIWIMPGDDEDGGWYFDWQLPDPLNSHTDCHALIEALRAYDKPVSLYFGELHRVELYAGTGKLKHESWSGDDYRTGVVTLALEVLREG